jgi:sorbitol-specific phosphotransferase system component IIBC
VYSAVIQIRAIMQINQVKQGSAVATVLIPLGILIVGFVILAIIASIALFAGLGALSD